MAITEILGTSPETEKTVVLPKSDLTVIYAGLSLENERRRRKAFDVRFTPDQRQDIYSTGALEALINEVKGNWLTFRLDSIQTGGAPDSLVVCCRGFNRECHRMEHFRIIKPDIEASLPNGYNPDQIRSLADSVLPEDYIPPYRVNDYQQDLVISPF